VNHDAVAKGPGRRNQGTPRPRPRAAGAGTKLAAPSVLAPDSMDFSDRLAS